jgi:hypothetical protein
VDAQLATCQEVNIFSPERNSRMKAKTLIACAITATTLPFASAFAQNASPSGPQGTGWYGAPNAATPIVTDRTERTDARQARTQRWVYQGFSADTNPPAPTY